jgi:hypothetical protein
MLRRIKQKLLPTNRKFIVKFYDTPTTVPKYIINNIEKISGPSISKKLLKRNRKFLFFFLHDQPKIMVGYLVVRKTGNHLNTSDLYVADGFMFDEIHKQINTYATRILNTIYPEMNVSLF